MNLYIEWMNVYLLAHKKSTLYNNEPVFHNDRNQTKLGLGWVVH